VSDNGPRRIGVVGAGWISTVHLEGMKRHPERAACVALCDPDAALAAKRAAEYGISRTFATVQDMIAAGGLDAAIVGTPTPVRFAVVAPLLEAGIPVLIEKPLSETYAEAVRIAALAARTGVPAAVNQSFRRSY
jgi:D-apiose dehydrogenase